MPVNPVVLAPTYGGESGNVAMSLLDGTYGQLQTALNEIATYATYFLDTGAVNAMQMVTAPFSFTLGAGIGFDLLVANTNSGPVTMNVNSSGPITVTDATGAALGAGTLISNTIYSLVYDGTNFRVKGVAAAGGTGPGSFTTLSVSSTISGAGVNALFAAPPPIGNTTANTGRFTNIAVSGVGSYTGLQTFLNVSVVPVTGIGLSVRSAGGAHSTQISDSSNNIYNAGYLSVPASSNQTLTIADRGKAVISASVNITVPAGVFAIGDVISIVNVGAAPLSIISNVQFTVLAATATIGSPRTLASHGIATIFFYATNGIIVGGPGVT